VAVLEDVQLVQMNDNHQAAPLRVYYKTPRLNATQTMLELYRESKLTLKLDDGRAGQVILQHSSMDSQGSAVGVLRVIGELAG
jgi:hypothetical protein